MVSINFKRWMKFTSPEKRRAVAKGADTSPAQLHHLVTGYRKASSDLAARIEAASNGEVTRADINETCRSCKYFKECNK